MRYVSIVLVAMLALSACSCAARRPYQRQSQFNPAEYAAYDRPAGASVSGQAFMKTRGGDVKFGAGNVVTLDPVTTYSTEWFEHTVKRNYVKKDSDPQAHAYQRETRADGDGRFTFENLPAGEYYIACKIRWQMRNGKYTGGVAHEKVHVVAGQQLRNVIVTR